MNQNNPFPHAMLYHTLKQIFRSLWLNKSFTLINLLGLSLGLAVGVLIFLIIDYEKGFDKFHTNPDQVYRIVSEKVQSGETSYSAAVPYPTAQLLREEYEGIFATQTHFEKNMDVRINEADPFNEADILFADSMFFQVLDFGKIENFWMLGNPTKALLNPNQVVLAESTARRYFGADNPIGKMIKVDNNYEVEVTGVVKDVTTLNHLPFSMIISYATLNDKLPNGLDILNWNFTAEGYSYVRLKGDPNKDATETSLTAIIQRNADSDSGKKDLLHLQSIADIHFDLTYENDNPTYITSDKYLSILVLLGTFIILIACVNYINLATSFAFNKSKEVGIRKSIGASKQQLFFHYMLETFVVTFCATLLGVVLAVVALPYINQILDKSMVVTQLISIPFIGRALGIILIITIISGVYPAMILAGFSPITALTNKLAMPGKSSVLLRKSLVIFQFTISTALIICTLVIASQMKYFQNKGLGFNKDAVIEVSLPERDSTKRDAFYTLLQKQSAINAVSFCLGAPISGNGLSTSFLAADLPAEMGYDAVVIACDRAYKDTYQMQMIAGRWFLPSEEQNIGTAVVVNRTLAKTIGYVNPEDALGQWIGLGLNDIKPIIVGVTEDFHTTSLHINIRPVAMTPIPYFHLSAGIRINPGDLQATLAEIEAAWKQVYPENVYEVAFIDQTLAARYEQENRDYQVFRIFSFISVLICCMGLWGLIAFVVVRKTREIGIRKVLGASISGIVILISRDFLKLVVIALVLSSTIAGYFMQNWLQNFAYAIELRWWIFALAGFISVVIAFLAISYPAIKAAMTNPINNLRVD